MFALGIFNLMERHGFWAIDKEKPSLLFHCLILPIFSPPLLDYSSSTTSDPNKLSQLIPLTPNSNPSPPPPFLPSNSGSLIAASSSPAMRHSFFFFPQ